VDFRWGWVACLALLGFGFFFFFLLVSCCWVLSVSALGVLSVCYLFFRGDFGACLYLVLAVGARLYSFSVGVLLHWPSGREWGGCGFAVGCFLFFFIFVYFFFVLVCFCGYACLGFFLGFSFGFWGFVRFLVCFITWVLADWFGFFWFWCGGLFVRSYFCFRVH